MYFHFIQCVRVLLWFFDYHQPHRLIERARKKRNNQNIFHVDFHFINWINSMKNQTNLNEKKKMKRSIRNVCVCVIPTVKSIIRESSIIMTLSALCCALLFWLRDYIFINFCFYFFGFYYCFMQSSSTVPGTKWK